MISQENLFVAWQEFLIGKRSKPDVQEFSVHLADNIISLHEDLAEMTYRHGTYEDFFVHDPKRRHIHKASVRDRLLHHAIYRKLYPYFDKRFIHDSYSCRLGKGVYKAIDRFEVFARKVSKNHTNTCWVLKCDIKKFFESINHKILINILFEHVYDKNILFLLENIIESYHSEQNPDVGLPLGNLTSQLFGNVYMNIFDQWVKHDVKAKYYIRYADDFVFLSQNGEELVQFVNIVRDFLYRQLHLILHNNKIVIKTASSGVDFLGWTMFPHYKILRKKTKERMFRKLNCRPENEVLQSYIGLLSHGDTYTVERNIRNLYWLINSE